MTTKTDDSSSAEPEGTNPKSIQKKETTEKRVQFQEPQIKKAPTKKPPKNPRRFGGGGKAKPLRDLCIFVAVMGIMLYMTADFEMPLEKDEDGEVEEGLRVNPVGVSLNKMADAFTNYMNGELSLKPPRTEPCDLYVQKSTIGGTGYSLFAGRNFAQGERLPGFSNSWSLPVSASDYQLLPHAFLLNHHPTQANVEGTLMAEGDLSETNRVVATREIGEGEELYVEFQNHPATHLPELFASIPSANDHHLAAQIRQDAQLTAKRLVQAQRKKSVRLQATIPMMGLARRSIELVRPQIAALLHSEEKYHPILFQHQRFATCASDIVVSFTEQERLPTLRTNIRMAKGAPIVVIPLQTFPDTEQGEECQVSPHCVSYNGTSYCPLLVSAETLTKTAITSSFNVELQWEEKPSDYEKASYVSWKLVALENLDAGAELNLSSEWKQTIFEAL